MSFDSSRDQSVQYLLLVIILLRPFVDHLPLYLVYISLGNGKRSCNMMCSVFWDIFLISSKITKKKRTFRMCEYSCDFYLMRNPDFSWLIIMTSLKKGRMAIFVCTCNMIGFTSAIVINSKIVLAEKNRRLIFNYISKKMLKMHLDSIHQFTVQWLHTLFHSSFELF